MQVRHTNSIACHAGGRSRAFAVSSRALFAARGASRAAAHCRATMLAGTTRRVAATIGALLITRVREVYFTIARA